MKILLVEDDDNKRSNILSEIGNISNNNEIKTESSLISGLRQTRSWNPDLIILDMTLPNYDGKSGQSTGQMHAFGGREFLKRIRRLDFKGRVVIVTQFESFGESSNPISLEDLMSEIQIDYPEYFLGYIYYHASISDWQEKLISIVTNFGEKVENFNR
ncbi:response regulator transcription factor [Thalassospira tepidiphila]|uniref:response regulator transcription factor n=1 Tax=Thalassospira tepidiphila TaxID=393657 RepID=UPI002920071F|nr:hypothetical protein MACH01_08980 [Thalassospira tepidiphila]